ncbi:GGDEF domain-containing response regulator [Anaerorhabdus furcosa]|uniref:Diguanylate cyclase (GGDEF) domain-containing protein n=1 Tax=Anaerorhabdus furcosa TaxID=118967 RepID=A0A1T4JY63_9FIRM|nr:diguanylate cyclase [Anaerorhabdus furcosa]SJZ35202.1 diguanylate cyclase (GGDEF) domain-containing protein [Anaerorhabdus furcosa]
MKDTILIVEDVDVNRKILIECLTNKYNYLQASNGKEALDILEDNYQDIHAILLDIVMPVMDGYEFLEQFKKIKEYQEIPVIAMTGIESKHVEERIIEAGAIDFLEKPYNPAIIRNRLKNTLELTRAIRAGRTDGLTGLLNRAAFRHEIETYLIESKKPAALMIIDIDNFKRVNDVYGHFFGDKVLIEFANIMLDECHGEHAIGRLGGDEFIVLLKNIEYKEKAKEIADGIIRTFNKSMSQYEGEVPSCSIGISYYPEHGTSRSEIYLHADEALYNAKRLGKSKSCFYLEGQEILSRCESFVGKEWILDALNAYIYISDMETGYIYYANKKIASIIRDKAEFVEGDIATYFRLQSVINKINKEIRDKEELNKEFFVGDKKYILLASRTHWGVSNCAKVQAIIEVERE